jgi:hypothetical protein
MMSNEFLAPVDKANKFKVESFIVTADWTVNAAAAGNLVPFEVRTSMVGNGSPIEVKGKSSKGKAPDTVKGKVYNNFFTGKLQISEKVDLNAEVWFEAKLPKHSLTKESSAIPVKPKIVISRFAWDKTIVHRGDAVTCTVEIESGVEDDTDAVIRIMEYDQDGNHDLILKINTVVENQKIEATWDFNYYKNVNNIPTQAELEPVGKSYAPPKYFFVFDVNGIRVGEGQESGLLEFRDEIKLCLADTNGEPIANEELDIYLADGKVLTGTLDENGEASFEDTAPGPFSILFKKISSVHSVLTVSD